MLYDDLIKKLMDTPEKETVQKILDMLKPDKIIDFNVKQGVALCIKVKDKEYYIVVQDVTEGG